MDAMHQTIEDNEAEHHRIISLLDSVIAGVVHDAISKQRVDELATELSNHFSSEMQRMEAVRYPWCSAHYRDHHRLEVILNLLVQYRMTEIDTRKHIYQVRDLFIDHIKQYDCEFDTYMFARLLLPTYERRSKPRRN